MKTILKTIKLLRINLTNIKQIANWLIIVLFLFGVYAFSCESQSPLEKESEDQSNVSALIVYDGDPAVDGCGWLILHGQNTYSPVNLDSNFQTDSLKIVLNYKILESTWNCGWREPGYRQIEILEIKKK